MHAEFVQNVSHVVDGGLFSDDKLLGNLSVAETATHEAYNLTLARGERAAGWDLLAQTRGGPCSGAVDQLAKKVQSVLRSDIHSHGAAGPQRAVEADFTERSRRMWGLLQPSLE